MCLQAPLQGMAKLLSPNGEQLLGSLHALLPGKLRSALLQHVVICFLWVFPTSPFKH